MSRSISLRFYIISLAVIAVVLPSLTVKSADFGLFHWIDFLIWTVLVIAAELTPITLPKGGAALSVGGVIDCSIILLFPTPIAAVYGAIAGITSSIRRRVDVERFIFNVSMLSITMWVASLVLELSNAKIYQIGVGFSIGGTLDLNLLIKSFLPFLGAIIVYSVMNTGLTSIAIAIKYGDSPISVWNANYKWMMVSVAAMGPIGLIMAVVYSLLSSFGYLWAILGVSIFFMPILIIRYAFRLFVDVNNAYFNSIKALVSALDASHHYTQGHSLRVSHNSVLVAKHLKMSDKEIETLRRGAILHDIGKIGLDNSILDKASPLSSEEWMQVKQHPILGARITGDLSFLQDARQIVLHHHERIDGKGYPTGLIGHEIPIGARIVNALDALDALTSERSYRNELTQSQALEILKEKAGEQFDTKVVDAVVELASSGVLVFQDYVDEHGTELEIVFTIRDVEEVLNLR